MPFAPDTPMHKLVKKATVRKGASVQSGEVRQIDPDTVVLVLEEAENDGHQRARIGVNEWLSLVTGKGKVLATHIGATASEADVVTESEPEREDPETLRRRCSWCSEETTHTRKTLNKLRRSVYTCGGCGKDTLACKACDKSHPLDAGMAKVCTSIQPLL